jgi:hypothetical protein
MSAALTERLVYVARAARDAGHGKRGAYMTPPALNWACPAPPCCAS